MPEQERIGDIGIVTRTRFDEKTETWYAEASLDTMCAVVQELERLRIVSTQKDGAVTLEGYLTAGWSDDYYIDETPLSVAFCEALKRKTAGQRTRVTIEQLD